MQCKKENAEEIFDLIAGVVRGFLYFFCSSAGNRLKRRRWADFVWKNVIKSDRGTLITR